VPDGAIVGRVRLHTRDGVAFEFPLRAGRDTSEWAYDSPVTHARHSRAAVATSYRVEAPEGNYEGHTYVTSFAFPERVTVTGGKVVAESSANWPNLQLGVFRVSLIDSGQGKAYPLRREWANIGDAVESEQKEKDREDRWRLLAETRYIDIYENRHALPRAWLASEARALGEQATLEVIRTGKLPDGSVWEPQRTALVESEPPAAFAAGTDGGRAEVTGYEANRVEVKTVSGAPAILVVGENHYPGWRAYLDGKRVGVLRVDYGLRGVIVPAGEHNVRFVYRPESALIGLLVSIATAAALALWCARLLPEKRVASQNQSATWGE